MRLEQPAGKFGGAGEARFLVDGVDKLERPVRDVGALHDRERCSHADAVVGAQRGALGFQPVAVANHLDGIGIEVVGGAFVLFADHVEMALQQSHGRGLASRPRGLANDGVADFVLHGFQP